MILVDNSPAPLFIAEHVSAIATQFFFWFDGEAPSSIRPLQRSAAWLTD
jgi:hypothetical protein